MKKHINNAKWIGNTLMYGNKKIAVRYKIDDKVRIFCYGKFKRYKDEIEARKDTHQITGEGDLLGNLGNTEWKDILCDIRQRKAKLQSLSESRDRIPEDDVNDTIHKDRELYCEAINTCVCCGNDVSDLGTQYCGRCATINGIDFLRPEYSTDLKWS